MTGKPRETDVNRQSGAAGLALTFDIADDEHPSEAVVRGIATATGRSVHDITPLFESIDPDALDALFEQLPDGTPRSAGQVVFPLDGCVVSIEGTQVRISRTGTGTGSSP